MDLPDLAATDDLWASYPERRARVWFVVRLIAVSVAEGQLRGRLKQARDIVAPLLPPDAAWFRPHWELAPGTEIVNGLLGLHPQSFDHLTYFYFVAHRRYRIVTRTTHFDDPLSGPGSKQGFVFPRGNTVESYKLNLACGAYWIKHDYGRAGLNRHDPLVMRALERTNPRECTDSGHNISPDPQHHRNDSSDIPRNTIVGRPARVMVSSGHRRPVQCRTPNSGRMRSDAGSAIIEVREYGCPLNRKRRGSG